MTGSQVVAYPIWLGDARHPAFGWWHCPADRRARAGVLLCAPLGLDYLQSHAALRLLADELAGAGFCVIRFDYDGTGDSAGGRSRARLAAWRETTRSALTLLRRSGLKDVCLVGMRFGAMFAAATTGWDSDVDQLVLWDPCTTGRSFLAEERALARLSAGERGATLEDGALEAVGIVYDAATVADIEGMSIDRCTRPLSRRVLVLARADRPRPATLCDEALAHETLTQGEALDQIDLMDRVPPFQELPLETIHYIVDWLLAGATQSRRMVSVPEPAGQMVVDSDALGRPVMEMPVRVPPVGLFGMLTAPGDGRTAEGAPLVLMLNAGTQHHVGPARAWVDLSRRWASAGIRSLRLDLSGLGDSPFRQSPESRWTAYKPEAFDDVLDAVTWAVPDDPSNVVLVGLCSGAYQALESGLLLRVRGVVAINPISSFRPPERRQNAPIDPRRRIALPKDDVAATFREGGRFGHIRERWPDLAWRARILMSPQRRSGKWLSELVTQRTDTLIVCGDTEIRPIRQGLSALGLRRLRHSGLLRLEQVAELDHVLSFDAQRQEVLDMITDHVMCRFHPNAEGLRRAAIDGPSALTNVPA